MPYLSQKQIWMKKILLFGAGKSATALIKYLGKECEIQGWKFSVCDTNELIIKEKIKSYPAAEAVVVNVLNDDERAAQVKHAGLVISLLPPSLHFLVAKDCVRFGKNLLTASYVDDQIKSLEEEIKQKGLFFLSEMGLDPGIDHMSAMALIHEIQNKGGKITSFKSHCGGLISPESDDNPWHYKITWNPANVVSAGKSGALFKRNNETVSVPYERIFSEEHSIKVPSLQPLSWYPNRDSLSYMKLYELERCETFIRTTLRYPSFIRGWNKIVALDLTNSDDTSKIANVHTWKDWFDLKLNEFAHKTQSDLSDFMNEEFTNQIQFLGLNSNENLPKKEVPSSELLLNLLEKKWHIQPEDKDMVVMMHEIGYECSGVHHEIKSSLVVYGENELDTAMSKTVGLPLGIMAKLILTDSINLTGLHIPVLPEIYEPVLEELKLCGIEFREY